jgi:hypothetical protein
MLDIATSNFSVVAQLVVMLATQQVDQTGAKSDAAESFVRVVVNLVLYLSSVVDVALLVMIIYGVSC